MSDYRWTLADCVLVVVFLVALYGVGVAVKAAHDMKKIVDESHATLVPDSSGIPVSGK